MRRPRSSDASLTGVLRGPFGLLWAGQSVSMLGDGVFLVAFTWQIAVEWQRPALLGLLLGIRVLAEVLTLGLGGWIIDRLARRTTVLCADGGRALLLLGLAAALHRPPPVVALALLVIAYGVLTALFRPALIAFMPEVVDRERLAAANSMLSLSAQAALVLGPALGAGLVGLGSATTALRLDSVSFALAAASVLPLPGGAPASSTGSRLAQALEGFRTVRRVGWVGGTILVCSIGNIGIIGAQRLALPKAAERHYGQLGGYGAVLVALGVGAAVAALLAARSWRRWEPGRAAYGGVMVFSVSTIAFGLVRGILPAVVVGFAFGFGQQFFELLWTTGLQRNVPGRLLGRISAVDQFGSFLFLPLSFAFGGLVVQAAGPERVLIGAGALGVALAAIGLAVPALHEWRPITDRPAPAPAPAPRVQLPVD